MTNDELEKIAQQLEGSDDFRVLRRMSLGSNFSRYQGGAQNQAIYLDLETTGLDPKVDEIIEIGMVPFFYNEDGTIYSAGEPFSKLREPSSKISKEVSAINNITNDMVRGKHIVSDEVLEFAQDAKVIIAHNASFDRVFLERLIPEFSELPWACSMSQIPWKEEGFEGNRLAHIASGHGFFFDAHRAVEDCWAGIEILSRELPESGEVAMSRMLSNARKSSFRIWAMKAPFELKEQLKSRGYRWSDGSDGRHKAWYIDVNMEAFSDEMEFLKVSVYRRDVELPVTKITAMNRFSERV